MSGADIGRVRAALFAALDASSPLAALVADRVYHRLAPDAAALPLVSFNLQGIAPEERTYSHAAYVEAPWLVKAIAESRSSAEAVYAAAHAALDTSGAVAASGVRILDCTRLYLVDYQETEPSDGTVLHHVGGVYRVTASEI